MTTLAVSSRNPAMRYCSSTEQRSWGKAGGRSTGGGKEGRKKTRRVMETEPFFALCSSPQSLSQDTPHPVLLHHWVLFPSLGTGGLQPPPEAALTAGCVYQSHTRLCLLCSRCTSGRRTIDKTGTASISKARTEVLGKGSRG